MIATRLLFTPALTLCASFLVTACLPVYQNSLEEIKPGQAGFGDIVQVRFLGVGGFSIRRGHDVVLTAPLYSNPRLTTLEREAKPRPELIRKFHPVTSDVKAILVGHAHYDHLMDVPYVWEKTPAALIYGNSSMRHILAGYAPDAAASNVPRIPRDKVVALNRPDANVVDYRQCIQKQGPTELARGRVDRAKVSGDWVYVPDSNVRFRALCSEHPPQILGKIHLWPGCVHRPRFAPPGRSEDFQEGETLAYLIDFLDADGKTPLFRIYYQDAPTSPTIGQVPEELRRKKSVDLALICVGNFFAVEQPTHIVENTNSRYIVLGHWEDFFRTQEQRLRQIPFAKAGRVVDAVQKAAPEAKVFMPAPRTLFHFRQSQSGVEMIGENP